MKNKFPLGWILAVAALLMMAGLGFMSSYYATGGKLIGGIIVAVCMIAVPIVLTTVLIKLKGVTKPFFFRSNAFKELGVLILVLAVCVVSMGLIDHFFAVNRHADEIGDIMNNMSKTEEAMLANYKDYANKRRDKYVLNLQTIVEKKKGNEKLAAYVDTILGTDTTAASYAKKIKTKGDTFYAIINLCDSVSECSNTSGLSILKKSKWWELPVLMSNADRISDTIRNEYDQLKNRSENGKADYVLLNKMCEYGLIDNAQRETAQDKLRWQYDPGDAVNIKHFFTDNYGFITSIWSVLVALVAFFLALLPYMAAYRDPRNKGLKEIFKKPTKYS